MTEDGSYKSPRCLNVHISYTLYVWFKTSLYLHLGMLRNSDIFITNTIFEESSGVCRRSILCIVSLWIEVCCAAPASRLLFIQSTIKIILSLFLESPP